MAKGVTQGEPEVHLLESGQSLQTHNSGQCFGQWCAIHRPMPGPWESWPRQWRDDRGILERVCPCGTGHPVAEMYEWAIANGKGFELVHGCCVEHACAPRSTKRDAGAGWKLGVPDAEAPTEIMARVTDDPPVVLDDMVERPGGPSHEDIMLMVDAMNLMIELWPQPADATVTLETHQWIRLRRVLSYVPSLVDRLK